MTRRPEPVDGPDEYFDGTEADLEQALTRAEGAEREAEAAGRERDQLRSENADLRSRLEIAERVCALFGITAIHGDSDRDKALHELWAAWYDVYGNDVERIDDAEIVRLARKRDETVRRTLARFAR